VGGGESPLTELDALYLQRAYELAARGIGNTSPNPPVGAVLVRAGRIVGEGYHHRAGETHAEANALGVAGDAARGATLYVSLEPCNHVGRMPACAPALVDAGVVRVVAGAIDPNPKTNGSGIAFLRERGIDVTVASDRHASELIALFSGSIALERPYLALKMAISLDGAIASRSGAQQWLTGEDTRLYVRDLRASYDAVMVGAGTVRVDNPQLTVRPPRHRLKPYVRVVACETDAVSDASRVFLEVEDYATTIVLAPAGLRSHFAALRKVSDVLFIGSDDSERLDLALAMRALREREICSVLCEGGPTLGGHLIAARLVDRFYFAIAPLLLQNTAAVPVLAGANLAALGIKAHYDLVECMGNDVMLSGSFSYV
jgi:diaminohydroxyphosphoribosylaminopyrimidine deaminase/5-amino-6-(5-phosphoribosylamino)uracil reductase